MVLVTDWEITWQSVVLEKVNDGELFSVEVGEFFMIIFKDDILIDGKFPDIDAFGQERLILDLKCWVRLIIHTDTLGRLVVFDAIHENYWNEIFFWVLGTRKI